MCQNRTIIRIGFILNSGYLFIRMYFFFFLHKIYVKVFLHLLYFFLIDETFGLVFIDVELYRN